MIHHRMNKKGFTLAEILITLGIIGIVAAMTLPSLISNYRKRVAETRIKRAYSLLNQAMLYAVKDNGASKNWTSMNSKGFIEQYLIPYLPGSVFISESRLGDMYVLNKDNSGKVTLNGGYSSGLKLKTGELIRVVDGFNPDQTSSFVGAQFGVILSENKSGIYYFGKDYFTFWYDINKDLLELTHGYGCSTKNELLIERCGLYGHDGACTSLIVCNGWKIPDYYPIRF